MMDWRKRGVEYPRCLFKTIFIFTFTGFESDMVSLLKTDTKFGEGLENL